MRKKIFFCFFVCVAIQCYSDEVIDSALLLVEYNVHSLNRLERAGDDVYVLEIGQVRSVFYNQTKKAYSDAEKAFCGEKRTIDKFLNFYSSSSRPPMNNCGYDIYKNYPTEGLVTTTNVIRKEFFYVCEDSVPELDWDLVEGDTVIATYPCLRAECRYRGRTWQAWYAPDIPYSDGPWKLGGLPGLILAANDSERHFVFDCVKMEQGNMRPMVFQKRNYEKCTTRRLNELKTEFWQDQIGFMSAQQGEAINGNFPGSPQKIFTYNPMEKFD